MTQIATQKENEKMIEINKNPLEEFVDELRVLMIKHDIRSITPLGNKMEISLNEKNNLTFVWSNIQTGIKKKSNIVQFTNWT